jgi:hypothetical protein
MTPSRFFCDHGVAAGPTYTVLALLGLVVAMVVTVWIGRSKQFDERMQFALVLVMTLFCFKHVQYDFVVLMVPVAAALVARKFIARTVVLHFWFISTIVNRYFPARVYVPEVMIYSVVLLIMAVATSRLNLDTEFEGLAWQAARRRNYLNRMVLHDSRNPPARHWSTGLIEI